VVIKECSDCEEKLLNMFREIPLNMSGCRHAGMHHRAGPPDEDGVNNTADRSQGNRKKPI